jgi:hypothetical protein
MAMGVLARSILLTNPVPAFLEYGKNIPVHTLIAIDTMHAAGLPASYSQLECLHSHSASCNALPIWRGGFLMLANCTSTLLCAAEPVVGKHLLASNTAGQVWLLDEPLKFAKFRPKNVSKSSKSSAF